MSAGGLRLPDGARIDLAEDQSSVTFVLPDGVFWVEETSSGELMRLTSKKYTCVCDGTEGSCSVLHTGMDFGCLHGSCSGTCTGAFGDGGNPGTTSVNGGFVDLTQGISFVKSHETAKKLLPFHAALLKMPEVQQGLETLKLHHVAFATGGHSLEGPSRIVGLNLYGTLVGMKLPESYIQTMEDATLLQEVNCYCESAPSGCVMINSGDVYICGGYGCKVCTIEVSDPGDPGTN
jgi:hypothetical protein